ncbi:MAG: hypothetical protein IJI09_03405 [Clostridia bacterium]|nr:hypothetical protein [Clostridia bacterium]
MDYRNWNGDRGRAEERPGTAAGRKGTKGPAFHLYNAKNCLYLRAVEVMDGESLRSAVATDHVAVSYRGGYRSLDRFISSDCLALDCDNDHSEDPTRWVTSSEWESAVLNMMLRPLNSYEAQFNQCQAPLMEDSRCMEDYGYIIQESAAFRRFRIIWSIRGCRRIVTLSRFYPGRRWTA